MRPGRVGTVLLLTAILACLSGCGWLWPEIPSDDVVIRSDLPRDLAPSLSEAESDSLAAGNGAFAFALYARAADMTGNVFFSPFSISMALAMTYAGARGPTEIEMADTLHFALDRGALHRAFNAIDLELGRRSELHEPFEGEGFELNVVNAVWGERGFPFLAAYLDTLAVSYGAGLRLAGFSKDPEGARAAINDWVSDETKQRIQDLLPAGSVGEATRLVLTNAIYFKAPWLHPFDTKETREEFFSPLDGSAVTVPMMYQTLVARYARVGNVQAVELPYNGGQLAMLLLVPDPRQFASVEAALDYSAYRTVVDALSEHEVRLGLPRFQFDFSLSLADSLRALGMEYAFDPDAADFSGIDGAHDLYISNVFHRAFVAVDEIGTEAAAATAVVISVTAIPGESVTLTIDRPFLLVIRDIPTDTILFLGRVTKP